MPEKSQETMDSAKRHFQIADHMFSVTFPLVKDTKLLLAILENIFLAYTKGISALLSHAAAMKHIPPFEDSFQGRLISFKEHNSRLFNLDPGIITDVQGIRSILLERKNSPVEFSKNQRFVICSSGYETKSFGIQEISQYLNKAKLFILAADKLLGKNEGIFGRSKE